MNVGLSVEWGETLQKWNKRWLILRRAVPRSGGSVRLEKYENEAAAVNHASSHCAVYDLSHMNNIRQSYDAPRNVISITLDDYSIVHIATDTSQFLLS